VNGPPTYHDLIARDKEVVKSVLLLTGSIEHIKQQVAEYLATFDKYSFLWTQDLQVRAGYLLLHLQPVISCQYCSTGVWGATWRRAEQKLLFFCYFFRIPTWSSHHQKQGSLRVSAYTDCL
jgi:hypothetical protein